jgi:hypothetical protein
MPNSIKHALCPSAPGTLSGQSEYLAKIEEEYYQPISGLSTLPPKSTAFPRLNYLFCRTQFAKKLSHLMQFAIILEFFWSVFSA